MGRSATRYHLDEASALTLLVSALEEAARKKRMGALLRGLFTASQRAELAQRLRIAFFLGAGRSFRAAAAETGASTKTVAAVDVFLRSRNPNYRRQILIRHRARTRKRTTRDPFRNPHIPLSGKWLFRELTNIDY